MCILRLKLQVWLVNSIPCVAPAPNFINSHQLLSMIIVPDSTFMSSLWQSTTTERNEDPKSFSFWPKTSRRFFPDFFCPNYSFYILVTRSPSLLHHPKPAVYHSLPAPGPGSWTPLESITATCLPSGSLWVYTKKKHPLEIKEYQATETGVFFFLLLLCFGVVPSAILCPSTVTAPAWMGRREVSPPSL